MKSIIPALFLTVTSLTALASEELPYIYQGKPIQPHVFKEFVPWLSDTNNSPTVTIDLAKAANARNEYDKNNITRDDFLGEHGFCSDYNRIEEDRYVGEVCYWWQGKLDSGLHLFAVRDYGGGRSSWLYQFLIKFHKGEEVDLETGKTTQRDLMTLMGTYGVYGDRPLLTVENGELANK